MKICHTELVLLTCRVVVFAGSNVFLPTGEIMVESLVITPIGKKLNNPANVKYYAMILIDTLCQGWILDRPKLI